MQEVQKGRNEPHILMVSNRVQFFVCTERNILAEGASLIEALKDLIAAFFIFDMEYPKSLYPLLIFLQRYVLNIRDSQRIPPIVTRVMSTLDQQ